MENYNYDFRKNDLQVFYAKIKGEVEQIIKGEHFSTIILKVGKNNKRKVALSCLNDYFLNFEKNFGEGDRVTAHYFLDSKYNEKSGCWHTTAKLLDAQVLLD